MSMRTASFLAAIAQASGGASGIDSLTKVQESVRSFISRQPGAAAGLLIALGLVLGLCVLLYLLQPALNRRRQERRWYDQLAEAHGLDGRERRALRRLAARAGLDHPALIFVRRSLFERHARELPGDLSRDLRERLYGL